MIWIDDVIKFQYGCNGMHKNVKRGIPLKASHHICTFAHLHVPWKRIIEQAKRHRREGHRRSSEYSRRINYRNKQTM